MIQQIKYLNKWNLKQNVVISLIKEHVLSVRGAWAWLVDSPGFFAMGTPSYASLWRKEEEGKKKSTKWVYSHKWLPYVNRETQQRAACILVLPRARRLLWTIWYSFFSASMLSLTQHDVLSPSFKQHMIETKCPSVSLKLSNQKKPI